MIKVLLKSNQNRQEEVHPETLSISITPMIIQLLVENGVKHGIANLKNGGKISLEADIDKERLCIKVINTGALRIAKKF